jgi:hypothetical protein
MNKLNKNGGMTDIFLFLILSVVVVFISGVFIFLGGKVFTSVEDTLGNQLITTDEGVVIANTSDIIADSLGAVNQSYLALHWISVFLIFGMIIAIFIGSYMVTTKPIFFIPYLFIVIIAVIVAVPISNAYETLYNNPTLNATFSNFVGASWIMAKLPIIISVVGIGGGIIMFVRMGKKEEQFYGI